MKKPLLAVFVLTLLFVPVFVLQSAEAYEVGESYSLVDSAKKANFYATGYFYEYDHDADQTVKYDAEASGSITLSPVSTDLTWESGNAYYSRFEAHWNNWKPVITATVVVHKPGGDEFMPLTWRLTKTELRAYFYNHNDSGYVNLYAENYAGSRAAGPDYTDIYISLRNTVNEPTRTLADGGDIRLNTYSVSDIGDNLRLNGTYSLSDDPTPADFGQDATPAKAVLSKNVKLPPFKMVDRSVKADIQVEGTYRVYDYETNTRTYYPATGTFTTNFTPAPSRDGTYRYNEYPNGSFYERYNYWWKKMNVMSGTITVEFPDGDRTFSVNAQGNVSSGFVAYRNTNWGNGLWSTDAYYDVLTSISTSGDAVDAFYDGGLWVGSDGLDEPKLGTSGEAYIWLYGLKGDFDFDGTYTSNMK